MKGKACLLPVLDLKKEEKGRVLRGLGESVLLVGSQSCRVGRVPLASVIMSVANPEIWVITCFHIHTTMLKVKTVRCTYHVILLL